MRARYKKIFENVEKRLYVNISYWAPEKYNFKQTRKNTNKNKRPCRLFFSIAILKGRSVDKRNYQNSKKMWEITRTQATYCIAEPAQKLFKANLLDAFNVIFRLDLQLL